jgi:hypothetical protein
MPNQPATNPSPEILLERDYLIQIFDEQKQLIPISVSFIRNFTISFDKNNITLSVYLSNLTDPINIKELQQAKTIEITYFSRIIQEPTIQHFEVLDIIGSTQSSINSEKLLGYALQFTLK